MYNGLSVIAFYLLIIGPIKDLVKHETTFTESFQNINGKIYEIPAATKTTLSCSLSEMKFEFFYINFISKLKKKSSLKLIFFSN